MPGIRHVVCLSFADGTSEAHLDAVVDALRALPAQVPELRSYEVGRDAGLAEGNAQLAVIAGFDDADGWRAYQQHPAHLQVIADLVRPHLAHRTAAQIELLESENA